MASSQIGPAKPNPALFHHIIQTLKRPPHQLKFTDDSLSNVQAAESMGIPSHHFQSAENLIAFLQA